MALHFSGHGIENKPNIIGKNYALNRDVKNYLLFETQDGDGELVSDKVLSEQIKFSNSTLEFVFVASCYSENVGAIFLNAGARHVICVRAG